MQRPLWHAGVYTRVAFEGTIGEPILEREDRTFRNMPMGDGGQTKDHNDREHSLQRGRPPSPSACAASSLRQRIT